MSDEILKDVASSIGGLHKNVSKAKDLIAALKDAGEDTMSLETNFRQAQVRMDRWTRMLEGRNIPIPKK